MATALLDSLKKSIGKKKSNSQAFAWLADLERESGDLDTALARVDGGLTLSPSDVPAMLVRSQILFQKGDFEGAAKLCTKKTAPLISLMASMAKDDKSFKKEADKLKGAKIEAEDCKIDGDTATVNLKVTLPSGESEKMDDKINLAKEDGNWKVSIRKD